MKYKCKVEKIVKITQEIEIDACDQERAELIFDRIRKGEDHRSYEFEASGKEAAAQEIQSETASVEYASGEKLPSGVFEFMGTKFEPVRKMTYAERTAFTKNACDPDNGVTAEGRCESCGWDFDRYLNEFYDAAYGAADTNWSIEVFRCLDDGYLYAPWKYGLSRWAAGEEYNPDYRDIVYDLVDKMEYSSDPNASLHWLMAHAEEENKTINIKVSFDEDSWFAPFGARFAPGELDYGNYVEKIAEALKAHMVGFGEDLTDMSCPIRAEKISVRGMAA